MSSLSSAALHAGSRRGGKTLGESRELIAALRGVLRSFALTLRRWVSAGVALRCELGLDPLITNNEVGFWSLPRGDRELLVTPDQGWLPWPQIHRRGCPKPTERPPTAPSWQGVERMCSLSTDDQNMIWARPIRFYRGTYPTGFRRGCRWNCPGCRPS